MSEPTTMGVSGGLMLFGNSAAVDADQCRNALRAQYPNACGRSRSRSKRAGGAVTTGVPRRFVKNALKNEIWAVSAGFFHPEFAPALRADITVDQRASIGVLEQRAVAALLITLWGILVCNRGLAHFRGRLLERQQHSGGPCRAPYATQENDSPRECGWLDA